MYKKWIGIAVCSALIAIGIELYLVKCLWAEPSVVETYVFKTDLKAGQLIQEKDLQIIRVQGEDVPKGAITNQFKWIGTKTSKEMPSGMILKASDFDATKENGSDDSLVLRLDYEQGHRGDVEIGEKISFLCYRQGEVKLISDLTVSGKEKDLQNIGGEGYYITVSGDVEALETLVLSKKEGSVHVLKKTAVHN